MSHFALRVGHLFHVHPSVHDALGLVGILKKCIPTVAVPPWEPAHDQYDDLAYLGMCKETQRAPAGAELDRYALIPDGTEVTSQWGLDESWLALL
jgi:hypothetical protein